jgi:aminoglycoside phosphotransferase (APT) family kinase protein
MGLTATHITEKLSGFLATLTGGPVDITSVKKLSGGAIQENWALDVAVENGDWAGTHELVMRCDAASGVATSHSRSDEFKLLKAAHDAGVRVPVPCIDHDDADSLGRRFFLMHRVSGTAAGHKLVRLDNLQGLAYELGENLARIHTIIPPFDDLAFLETPPQHPAHAAIRTYRKYLDELDTPHPAIEWGLRWLEVNATDPSGVVLCHRDYRTGNYMVEGGKLMAVLDWEFAGWSDPLEDLGWLCAGCWRFGANGREAGGIGEREDFYRGYETASGQNIDRAAIYYWEVMAHVRWAVIACQQAARHVSGEERSLELALTAHVVPELELEILNMTEPRNA